jgi:defect-in-organelle-trafficking protein DotC
MRKGFTMIRFATTAAACICAFTADAATPEEPPALSPVPVAATAEPQELARPTLEALSYPESKASTGVSPLRAQMLRDAARTVGFRGGLSARAAELLRALNARARGLETMFQFSPLVSKTGTIPPVIVAADNVAAFSPDQIRTAHQVYKIEREERFVSVPPTWRDYLVVGLPNRPEVQLPDLYARPQDANEQTIWKTAVQEGWAEGQQQADAILMANFNRLVRDYNGMLLYSTLLQQGIVSSTRVAESRQTLTGDQRQIVLGDTLRRVTRKAAFETDPRKWRPTIQSQVLPSAPGSGRVAAPGTAASGAASK